MIRDLLLFLRAPLAASAIANLLVGIALARPAEAISPAAWAGVAVLALATLCLYWAGMGLNDLFDLERDRELFPNKPLPSGRLPHGLAKGVAWGLLLTGVGCGGLGAWLATGSPLRGLFGASAVAICILAYDAWLKRWKIPGAIAMGACRFSNALFGAYALGWWSPTTGWAEALPLYALILGGYVMALTFLSTYEEESAGPLAMTGGFLVTAAAPGVLLALCLINDEWRPYGLVGGVPLFGVVLAQWIMAIMEGTRARGQSMTRAFLQALWLLDLGVVAGRLETGWIPLLVGGVLLFLVGKLGAKILFRPPPDPTTPAPGDAPLVSDSSLEGIPELAADGDPAPVEPDASSAPAAPAPSEVVVRPVPESFETKLPSSATMDLPTPSDSEESTGGGAGAPE
ncbi:MAG: UbiA family prenyltransferase [Planctomycetes bacterium]|nr:UbiA family prenyltransferase [Planctomycetota bacterium]